MLFYLILILIIPPQSSIFIKLQNKKRTLSSVRAFWFKLLKWYTLGNRHLEELCIVNLKDPFLTEILLYLQNYTFIYQTLLYGTYTNSAQKQENKFVTCKIKSSQAFWLDILCIYAYDCKLIMFCGDCWYVPLWTHTSHWFLNVPLPFFFFFDCFL